jgi:hypothetical protein
VRWIASVPSVPHTTMAKMPVTFGGEGGGREGFVMHEGTSN